MIFLCHLWKLWQAKFLKEFSYVVFQNIYNSYFIFKAMVHHKLIFVCASRNGSVYLSHCLSFICEKYFLSTVELSQCLSEIKIYFSAFLVICYASETEGSGKSPLFFPPAFHWNVATRFPSWDMRQKSQVVIALPA